MLRSIVGSRQRNRGGGCYIRPEKSISVQMLGEILGLTARRINQLVTEKWIAKSARNVISLNLNPAVGTGRRP